MEADMAQLQEAEQTPLDRTAALLQRVLSKECRVGIIGMGYVGLPLALTIAGEGIQVIGFDLDEAKVGKLNRGESYIGHIQAQSITEAVQKGALEGSADFSRLGECDVILVCVPTPLTANREPDMSYVVNTVSQLASRLRPGQIIILESTTYPGTIDDLVKPALQGGGLTSGEDFFLAYSPEREDPGNQQYGTATIPKVVGGDGKDAVQLAAAFYRQFTPRVVEVSSAATAEAVKLTENIFRAVNIALVNELKVIYGAMGIDVWEVIEAAKTKPFGFMPFYPGPGLGGHCIPIDPFYLTWRAREFGISTKFIELAGEVNNLMPVYVVDTLARGIDQRLGRGLTNARILLIGMAYKKNVDDVRESASLRIFRMLEQRGAKVSYFDPYVPELHRTREYPELAGRQSITWDPATIAAFDASMILTDHDCLDVETLVAHSKLVVDTRNATSRVAVGRERIIKA